MESSEEFSDTDQLLEESQQTLPTPISGSDPLEPNEAGEVKFEEMSISLVVFFFFIIHFSFHYVLHVGIQFKHTPTVFKDP